MSILWWAAPAPAAAQIAPGTLVVSVTDAETHAPLENAEVFLLGPNGPASGLTRASGSLRFDDVDPAIYRVKVQHRGYQRVEIAEFEVPESRRVTLNVELAPELKEVGRVTARSSATVHVVNIDEDSAVRRVSESMLSALDRLAGVSVNQSGSGPDSESGISLRNRDASQTAYSINGVRIGGGGGGALAASDLFSGASVDFTSSAGAFGGTVDFRTVQPTKTPLYRLMTSSGNFGKSFYSFAASGSAGRLGYALQHARRDGQSPLSGAQFADQSGLLYAHDGGSANVGELLRLRYNLTKKLTLNATALLGNYAVMSICSSFITLTPCGDGPGNPRFGRYAYNSLAAQLFVGNVSLDAGGSINRNSFVSDSSHRLLAGAPFPAINQYLGEGASIYATLSNTSGKQTRKLGYTQYTGTQKSTRLIAGVPSAFSLATLQSSLSVSDKVLVNPKLSFSGSASLANATGTGKSTVLNLSGEWRPRSSDTVSGFVTIGSAQPTFFASSTLGDAAGARFDCAGGQTFVSGPNDAATKQSLTSIGASFQRNGARGSFSVSVYNDSRGGQELSGVIPLDAEDASVYPGGRTAYISQLAAAWSAPTVCGTAPFDPSLAYVSQRISGIGQRYRGVDLSGKLNLGRNLAAFPTFSFNEAVLTSLDQRLTAANSPYFVGAQLPQRPLYRGGVTFDLVQPRASLEWLANAQYVGPNNQQNQPAYTTVNAGVVRKVSRGSLTLLLSNLFGTDGGLFTTARGLNPYTLRGGRTAALPTTPLPPRQWTLQYSVNWPAPKPAAAGGTRTP